MQTAEETKIIVPVGIQMEALAEIDRNAGLQPWGAADFAKWAADPTADLLARISHGASTVEPGSSALTALPALGLLDVPSSTTAGALGRNAWPARRFRLLATTRREKCGLAAVSGGIVEGFYLARRLGETAEIFKLAVRPDRRRRGVGRALLTAGLARGSVRGCREWVLEVRAGNHPARALYAALGFAEAGRRRDYYRDPMEDAVVLRLRRGAR